VAFKKDGNNPKCEANRNSRLRNGNESDVVIFRAEAVADLEDLADRIAVDQEMLSFLEHVSIGDEARESIMERCNVCTVIYHDSKDIHGILRIETERDRQA
jgi:hypothetical protein